MYSSEIQKPDESRLSLNESMTEEDIAQHRLCNDSTPKSNQSSESDGDNNELAAQGFERFRESSFIEEDGSSESSLASPKSPRPTDSIAEYCTESLYSYSFTPLSRVTKAAKIKRQTLNRSMDYMHRLRWKTGDRDTGRRFSQPDIGILDDWTSDGPEQLKGYPSMVDMIAAANNLSPSSSPQQQDSHTIPTTPVSLTRSALDAKNSPEVDAEGFHLGRRQTIEVVNNLPPIYKMPKRMRVPISAQYTRALHAPSRFLPQNQAILTTDAQGTILLFNDMASLCFGIDKSYIGKTIISAIEEPFQNQISSILNTRRNLAINASEPKNNRLGKGLVLVCGVVVPIRKMNGETSSAASLWLKEKITDEGKSVYIWIFEEIYETCLTAHLDDEGHVTKLDGTTKELFGYEPDQVVGKPITLLIPSLSNDNVIKPGVDLHKIGKLKFYGGRSTSGICFPIMVNIVPTSNVLKIVSLPSIAGLITVHDNGKIQSINPVPAKYLFGYSTESLIEKFNIDQIIPQFSDIVAGLRRCDLLQCCCTVNNHACQWAISEMCTADAYKSMEVCQSLRILERLPSISVSGQRLPLIYAVHRDGSQFEIQLQLRLIESERENLISIWVTYDRIHALRRTRPLRKKSAVNIPTVVAQSDDLKHPLNPIVDNSLPTQIDPEEDPPKKQNEKNIVKKRPPIRPYGISSFGSVDQKKALFPQAMTTMYEEKEGSPNSSSEQVNDLEVQENEVEPSKKNPIDDYVIIDTLGEGAYGAAKLAYRKDDPTKVKVVIKFIIKSRIVIDSWIRDRRLGLIPLEIHILKKLQEFPHKNCCTLETYFEDEDTYFVVMKIHGTRSMDLFDYIELNEHIAEIEIRDIFKEVALAVKHIHDLRIVHRDIKDENILLDENGSIQLIDFGSAAYFRKGRTFDTFGGTLDYCAPEILNGMAYEGPPQDIWSLGTLLYTLIYRENPFYNVDEIMEHDLRIPFVLSESSLDLIKKMLNRDVDKRFNINQVLEHPWLKSSQSTTNQ